MMGGRSDGIQGQHVVVIGGTSGIGRAIAQQSVAAGARVTVASRNPKRVDDTAARLGAWCKGRVCDVTDPESLGAFFEYAGQVDHLVLPGNEVRSRRLGNYRWRTRRRRWPASFGGSTRRSRPRG